MVSWWILVKYGGKVGHTYVVCNQVGTKGYLPSVERSGVPLKYQQEMDSVRINLTLSTHSRIVIVLLQCLSLPWTQQPQAHQHKKNLLNAT